MPSDHQPILRTATVGEASTLSELALRSKGYWGYSADFLEACRAELTVTPQRCASGGVTVAVRDDRILGFHVLEGSPPDGELAALFVDTDVIGTGIGGQLLRHALGSAVQQGFRTLSLEADPGAEGFYLRYGAVRVGEVASGSIPGRLLPHLRFELITH